MSNKINFENYFWENVKLGSQDVVINYCRRNFNTFGISLLEREGDKEQLDKANSIYYEVLDNIENIKQIEVEGSPAYNLKPVLNQDFLIVFFGKKFGTLELEYNGKLIPTMVVGSEIHYYTGKEDLKRFWKNNKLYVIHELIHLSDYKRVSKIQKSNLLDLKKYYNNPLEFNAFYLEIAQYFYDKTREEGYLPERKYFIKNAWQYIKSEQPELKSNISEKMKIKWNKRLYQLYDELKKEFNISP